MTDKGNDVSLRLPVSLKAAVEKLPRRLEPA